MGLNLWFYSSDDSDLTLEMDVDLFNSLRTVHPKITFIPTSHVHSSACYDEFKYRFDRIGSVRHFCLSVDDKPDKSSFLKALDSDLIYLGGGNTYYFLWHLRNTGMLKFLADFVREGKVLAGSSAGGIIMTPSIRTAGFPDFDKDDNFVGIKDETGLGLVGFEFFPHFEVKSRYVEVLCEKSEQVNVPIYGVPDGGGIRVTGKKTIFYDDCYSFFDGTMMAINPQH